MSLADSIKSLAESFAEEIMNAIRGASLQELLGEAGESVPRARRAALWMRKRTASDESPRATKPAKTGKPGRLARRTPEQIAEACDGIASLLKKHANGLRSEQIRDELGLDKREVPRLLQQGIEDKKFKILGGQKRATVYGVGGKSAKSAKAAPAKKKAHAKKAKPVKAAKAVSKKTKKVAKKPAKKAASKTTNGAAAPAEAAAE